jgi:hypothetical protein
MCDRGVDFFCFYNFSVECWNCSDSVVFSFFTLLKISCKVLDIASKRLKIYLVSY